MLAKFPNVPNRAIAMILEECQQWAARVTTMRVTLRVAKRRQT